jgi:hypothetical protein
MKHQRAAVSVLFAVTLTASLFVAPAAFGYAPTGESAAPSGEEIVVVGDTDALSEEQKRLYYSDQPKVININTTSGDVVSVDPLSKTELRDLIEAHQAPTQRATTEGTVSPMSWTTGCAAGAACWYGIGPALTYQYTLGTTTGTWTNRQNFYTGNYYAKLCWMDPLQILTTYCMPERNGKNAWITLGSAVTGKSVNVSTTR